MKSTTSTALSPVRAGNLGRIRQLGRLIAVVEELIEWDFESPGQFFQCLDCRNGMTVRDSRNVGIEASPYAFRYLPGKALFVAQVAEAVTNCRVSNFSNVSGGV